MQQFRDRNPVLFINIMDSLVESHQLITGADEGDSKRERQSHPSNDTEDGANQFCGWSRATRDSVKYSAGE